MRYLLMPGLDGTGDLFGPFRAALPASASVTVVRYPAEQIQSCGDLVQHIPIPDEPFVLVAESFSGPPAIMLAAKQPPKMKALALVATFARWPSMFPKALARPLAVALSRGTPPDWAVRHFLVGSDACDACVAGFQKAVARVPRDVLASRLIALAKSDVREDLKRSASPIIILSGRLDRLVRQRFAQEMRSSLADAVVVAVDGPHLLLQTRPKECATAIDRFLLPHREPD